MMTRGVLAWLLSLSLISPLPVAAQQTTSGNTFQIETRSKVSRKTFVAPEYALWLALIVKYGQGAGSQRSYAQRAQEFSPMQPGNCLVVADSALYGGTLWLMLNNGAVNDDTGEHKLKIRADHYTVDKPHARDRVLLRSTEYEDITYAVNPQIEVDDDPAVRVVFSSNVSASAAVRFTIAANGSRDFNERAAGSYLLILDRDILDDGYFPECRRRRAKLPWPLSFLG